LAEKEERETATHKFEVTSVMIKAGAELVSEYSPDENARDVAERVFMAMWVLRPG